jgi:hypothetical protein
VDHAKASRPSGRALFASSLSLLPPVSLLRRCSDAAAADPGAASASPGSPYGTPLAAHRTPPPGLPELLAGDYSMRRFGEEGWKLAGEATPPHPSSASGGFISAYPAGGVPYGGTEAVSSASKTPLLHLNPLAM